MRILKELLDVIVNGLDSFSNLGIIWEFLYLQNPWEHVMNTCGNLAIAIPIILEIAGDTINAFANLITPKD